MSEKGFFKKLFKKQQAPPEKDLLKEALDPKPQPSIQAAFEEQAAQKEPMPNEMQLPSIDVQEEIPIPPPPTPEQQAPPMPEEETPPIAPAPEEQETRTANLDHLKTQLADMEHEQLQTFTLPDGTPAITRADLATVIEALTDDSFKEHQRRDEFSLWIKHHLLDSDLAHAIHEATTRQQAITLIKQQKKQTPIHAPEKPLNHHDIDEHFKALEQEHEQTMADLSTTVTSTKTPHTPATIKELLLTKNHETAKNLHDLLQALHLMKDETYQDLVTNRKEELEEQIRELAKKAARIEKLNPTLLQTQIQQELEEHDRQIKQQLKEKKAHLKEEAENLIKREDELHRQEEEVKNTQDLMEEEERLLEEREQQWATELKKELLTIDEQARKQQTFIEEQEAYIKQAAKEEADRKAEYEERLQRSEQREKEIREQELALMEKKKATEVELMRREANMQTAEEELKGEEAALKEREASFAKEKEAHEQDMQKREELVQKTVDQLLAIDNEIHEERAQVEAMQEGLDHLGFQKLLQRELQKLHELPHMHKEEEETDEQARKLDELIDTCSEAIENKSFGEAKQHYNELKTFYEEQKLSAQEREVAYEALQQLYTNLHLALLEN